MLRVLPPGKFFSRALDSIMSRPCRLKSRLTQSKQLRNINLIVEAHILMKQRSFSRIISRQGFPFRQGLLTPMSTSEERRIRILLIEEECLVRAALQKLLESWSEFQVVGDAGTGAEGLELLDRLSPHVVLLTLTENGAENLEIICEFARASAQLLVLVGENLPPAAAAQIVGHGARGVVRKNKAPDELRRAIKKIDEGSEIWLDRASLATLVFSGASRPDNHTSSSLALLTQREREVAGLVNKGLKNKEVGERLFISETTVRHHLTTIFNKLEVRNRFELIDHLHRHKLATSSEKTLLGSNRAK